MELIVESQINFAIVLFLDYDEKNKCMFIRLVLDNHAWLFDDEENEEFLNYGATYKSEIKDDIKSFKIKSYLNDTVFVGLKRKDDQVIVIISDYPSSESPALLQDLDERNLKVQ